MSEDIWMVLRVKLPVVEGKTPEQIAKDFEQDIKPHFKDIDAAMALETFCTALKAYAVDFDVHYEMEEVRYGGKDDTGYKN
jgi:hypothetical protein